MFQKILLSIVLFFAISIVAFFLLLKVIDFNEYKPRIQKAIKENTGYEVMIRGDITLSLSPAGVSIFDVEIINPSHQPEIPFAKLGSFDVALDLSALLKKEVKIRHVSVDNLSVFIEKDKEGKYSYELPLVPKVNEKKEKEDNVTLEKEEDFPLVNVKKIEINNANIVYTDVTHNTQITFEKIDLNINDINYDVSKHRLQSLLCTMDTHIAKIQYGTYTVHDIWMSLGMKDAIAVSENIRYTLFDTPILGSGKFDLSGKQPKISIRSKIIDLKLANVSRELWNQDLLEGSADGEFRLSFFVGDSYTFKSTLNGFVQLYGENVTLKGYDIDKIALALDPNQRPKGFNFGNLVASATGAFKGGNTLLKEINTKIDIGYSEIKLTDVAMSSAINRVAMKGSVNIVDEKFMNLGVAILDAKGCPSFEQKTSGSFSKPSMKVEGTAITALNNVMLSFSTKPKATSKHSDENCTVFYDGVIRQPVPEPSSTSTQQGE